MKCCKGVKVKNRFWVDKLTSLLQVKWAWEKYHDLKEEDLHKDAKGGRKYEYFIAEVAQSGNVSFIKWLRQVKK